MKKINDRFFLGFVNGIISGIPGRLLNTFEYHKGFTNVKYGQMSAGIFLPKSKLNTNEGRLVGYIVNQINLGIIGVLIAYLISATGRDKAVLKGTTVSSAAWVIIYGLITRISSSKGNNTNKAAPLLSFLDHLILGILCGLFTSKLGDDALFPDEQPSSKEKLPLFYNCPNN